MDNGRYIEEKAEETTKQFHAKTIDQPEIFVTESTLETNIKVEEAASVGSLSINYV